MMKEKYWYKLYKLALYKLVLGFVNFDISLVNSYTVY